MSTRLLRTKDVLDCLNISRETLRRWRVAGIFPEPRRLGPGTLAWDPDVIESWVKARPGVSLAKRAEEGGK